MSFKRPSSEGQDSQAEKQQQTKREAILAEKDPELRKSISSILEEQGYSVIEVVNGNQLMGRIKAMLKRPREQTVSLVIAQVDLPGFTGLEVLAYLRTTSIKLSMVLTAPKEDRPSFDRASELGAAAVLARPLDLEELQKTLVRLGSSAS